MSIWSRAGEWWRTRDGRERRMLAVMFAAIAAFAWWYGLIVPMQRLRDGAREDYLQTVSAIQAMAADLERVVALRAAGPRPAGPDSLPATVLSTAAEAGLAISRQRDVDGGFEVGIDSAAATQVFAWLDTLRMQHGLAPDSLQVERHNGGVRVQASFVR